jgi:hypothetical protein
MTLPSVSIQKIDGGTGTVRPSDTGVLAIIATSEKGTTNQPATYLRTDVALTDYGSGKLVECAAYVAPVSGNPVVLVKGAGTTAAAYGSVALVGTGTSVPTGDGSVKPFDDYNVLITVIVGATIGVSGATYTYSLDGGVTTSAVQSLGTAAFILIPNTGVKIDLAAGNLVAGDTITVKTTSPIDTNSDLVTSLEALRTSKAPFEMVLFDGLADATTVSDLDTWLNALALTGRFKTAVCTARARTVGSETEAQYKTYLQGIFGSASSLSVVVCADVGDVSSPIPNRATTAIVQARPVGWAVAARAMKIPLGRDPAFVDDGPVSQFAIVDSRGNPNHHDEFMNPGLDDLRLATLRTFDGRQGSFITNAPLISTTGSSYVFIQHARTINRACEIAFQILGGQLSRGVAKNPKAGTNGERYIAEGDALRIEASVNQAIRAELAGQVDDIHFALSRTDDISSNSGATCTGQIQSVALAYIKKFTVTAGFVKAIST